MFHVRIAEATGNSVLTQVVMSLWDHMSGPIWAKADEHFHSPELRETSYQDHHHVFRALVERNPAAARQAMRQHIERVVAGFANRWR
jgi:DNA-binding FadR family transcriptional regulator